MTDFFSTPDDLGEIRQSELRSSYGDMLAARAKDALDPKNSLSGMWIFRRLREAHAGGEDLASSGGEYDPYAGTMPSPEVQAAFEARRAAIPETSIADARARVKQEGLDGHMHLPDQPSIKTPVLDLMLQEAHERRDREMAIARGPQGFIPDALGLFTSIGAGMIDPVNIAAFSIPVLGEARMGKLLASAGDSILNRAGVRALQGGAQGAVGTAVLQPADWYLHTQDGQDYTFADALKSVVMGAGMGAAFHSGLRAIGDVRARMKGAPLPGSPEDLLARALMTGRHIPAEVLDEVGITPVQLTALGESPAWAPPVGPMHPAEALADLPPAAREDVLRGAMADVINGQPVRAAEMLGVAAGHDPRIAESFDAWHGSPHDFERFDISKLGTGEGAQVYGHGLYFAENEKVARAYKRSTSDKAFIDKVAELYDEGFSPADAWAEVKAHWSDFTAGEQRLMTALEKDDWLGFDYPHQAVSAALREIKNFDVSQDTADAARAIGNMYRVRLTASQEHFLDWSKPVSEQSPHVRQALANLGVPEQETLSRLTAKGEETFHSPLTGAGVLHVLGRGDMELASKKLAEAGIPGIKYLDRGSRGAGEGTRNFVVFDDKHIEITHKNGEPVKQAELPPKLHALSAEARNWPELPQGATISGAGDNGPVIKGLDGRWREAIDWLRQAQTGDAIGVLEHPEVPGRIDLIWGDSKHGLAHIDAVHPGEAERLPDFWSELRERPGSRGRYITLESDRARAVIARDYRGDPKHWLLTYFELKRKDGAKAPSSSGPGDQTGLRPADDLRSQPSGYYSGEGAGPEGRIGGESGAGNRSHGERAALAAQDPRWHELADTRPAYDDPQAVAESRAADELPEPGSLVPEKSLTALEQAAADAEEVWRRIAPTLPEEVRARAEEALAGLKDDAEARSRIIEDGAACLAAAVM